MDLGANNYITTRSQGKILEMNDVPNYYQMLDELATNTILLVVSLIVKLDFPFLLEKGTDGFASLQKLSPVAPLAVCGVS